MLNKLIARLVRYLRQFYTDIDIEYWLNSEGNFIGKNGKAVTMDTALLDCIHNCQKHGIYSANDYLPQFRKLMNKREKGSVFISESGVHYTINIDYIRID